MSRKEEGIVWGGEAITPGCVEEMSSLHAELRGAIDILLVLYALQIQKGSSLLPVKIWIDNAELLERAK